MNLFESVRPAQLPLAEKLRPKIWQEFSGQKDVLKALAPFLQGGRALPNIILWGPPGCGKTTLARILATHSNAQFLNLHAVETGAKEIRELGAAAHERKIQGLGETLIFIDEIHRLNRAQQDVLLPFTEAGDFTLIGATTENPSYELNSALLSRARVVVLSRLGPDDLRSIFTRGCVELGLDPQSLLTAPGKQSLFEHVDGDARKLLSALEALAAHSQLQAPPFPPEAIATVLQQPSLRYDKKGDEHYDTISAFIKSVRGSDPQASIYYLARMLAGGEDPVFIARRLVVLASEDIGNADPRGLTVAVSALQAVELVGMPEAAITLAQVTTYLSCAPKSNASYLALKKAQANVQKTGNLPIPKALRSARTALTKQLGYGDGYRYAHDGETGWQKMEFLPTEINQEIFYEPTGRGFEKTMEQYLDWMKNRNSDS